MIESLSLESSSFFLDDDDLSHSTNGVQRSSEITSKVSSCRFSLFRLRSTLFVQMFLIRRNSNNYSVNTTRFSPIGSFAFPSSLRSPRESFRMIGGYWLSSLTNFDLCYSVETDEDKFAGFLLTIGESEKYDKVIQSKWIEQLQQKYVNVDQVNESFLSLGES